MSKGGSLPGPLFHQLEDGKPERGLGGDAAIADACLYHPSLRVILATISSCNIDSSGIYLYN